MALKKDGDQLDGSYDSVLLRVEEDRSISGKANWIGYILHRNVLLKHVIEVKSEGRTEVMGRG
jgi:hypothetical protein